MSRLSKFLATPKEIEIQGEKFKIYPVKAKDLVMFDGDPAKLSKEEQLKMTVKIIKKSLRDDDDVTEEEIENLDSDILVVLSDAVLEVSGLTDKNGALARIKQIKEQNLSRQ